MESVAAESSKGVQRRGRLPWGFPGRRLVSLPLTGHPGKGVCSETGRSWLPRGCLREEPTRRSSGCYRGCPSERYYDSDRLDSVAAESSRGICQKLLESVPRDCFFWTPVWERSHQGLAERMSGRKAGTLWRTLGTKLPGRMSEASGHTSFSAVCRNSLRGCLAKPPWPSVRLFPPLAGLPGSGEVWDESSCVPQGCPRERSHAQKLVVILL